MNRREMLSALVVGLIWPFTKQNDEVPPISDYANHSAIYKCNTPKEFSREEIFELGRKNPYYKHANFLDEIHIIDEAPVENSIDWYLLYGDDARWDIVSQAMRVMENGLKEKKETPWMDKLIAYNNKEH